MASKQQQIIFDSKTDVKDAKVFQKMSAKYIFFKPFEKGVFEKKEKIWGYDSIIIKV